MNQSFFSLVLAGRGLFRNNLGGPSPSSILLSQPRKSRQMTPKRTLIMVFQPSCLGEMLLGHLEADFVFPWFSERVINCKEVNLELFGLTD